MIQTAMLMFSLTAFLSTTEVAPSLPAVNTRESLGTVDGLEIELVVQSPSAQETDLQVVCLFEYTEGDITTSPPALPKELNGLVHVDEALHGLITQLRASKQFEGKSLETLLIIPPPNTIAAKQLLLIGLGDRNIFDPQDMRLVGVTGMREALRLNASNYAHASDLKDAGFSSPTAEVTDSVIQGAIQAFRTQKKLNEEPLSVKKVSMLSGPAFFEDSKAGILNAIKSQ